ncbi:MAG: hypothetical protein ACJ707_06840 [Nitrososphaera sp.]
MPKFPHYILVLSILLSITTMTAYATVGQQQQEQPTEVLTTNSTVYTDDTGFTVNLPPGWTAVDHDNTSQDAKEIAASQLREILVEFCPPGQGIVDNATSTIRCNDDFGVVRVSRYVNMERNPDFVRGASSVDPSTGLIVMNLTAQDLVDFHDRWSPNMNIVQRRDVLINISSSDNGGTQWTIPGKLVLAGNQINQLGWIQLLFVDWTSGYEATYIAPKGREGPTDAISIFGIGLDRLPEDLEPVMQILASANLQRPPSG